MINLLSVINKICAMAILVFFPGVVVMIWHDQARPRSWSRAISVAWTEWVNMFWRDTIR